MRTYMGTRVHGREPRSVPIIYISDVADDGISKTTPLKHFCRHSPDGFEWGYGGSGPSDTALSIMVNYFNHRGMENAVGRADLCYQDFKWEFIANAPEDGFVISEKQIEDWLKKQDGR